MICVTFRADVPADVSDLLVVLKKPTSDDWDASAAVQMRKSIENARFGGCTWTCSVELSPGDLPTQYGYIGKLGSEYFWEMQSHARTRVGTYGCINYPKFDLARQYLQVPPRSLPIATRTVGVDETAVPAIGTLENGAPEVGQAELGRSPETLAALKAELEETMNAKMTALQAHVEAKLGTWMKTVDEKITRCEARLEAKVEAVLTRKVKAVVETELITGTTELNDELVNEDVKRILNVATREAVWTRCKELEDRITAMETNHLMFLHGEFAQMREEFDLKPRQCLDRISQLKRVVEREQAARTGMEEVMDGLERRLNMLRVPNHEEIKYLIDESVKPLASGFRDLNEKVKFMRAKVVDNERKMDVSRSDSTSTTVASAAEESGASTTTEEPSQRWTLVNSRVQRSNRGHR